MGMAMLQRLEETMTIDGLEKMLRQEVKLSNQQISFNEVRGHDDQYERGYRDALKMVINNLKELPRGESIPVEFIEDWSASLWMGMSDLVCQRLLADWRKHERTDEHLRSDG